MRETMLDMMSALAAAVVASNRTAGDLHEAADKLGDDPSAETLRLIARRHRVETLELQGKLAGLTNDYVEQFGAM